MLAQTQLIPKEINTPVDESMQQDGDDFMSDALPKIQVEFYVAKGGANYGPFLIPQIAEMIAKGELAITDFVYDEARADWISLMECGPLLDHLRRAKPAAPPMKQAPQPQTPAPQMPQAPVPQSQPQSATPVKAAATNGKPAFAKPAWAVTPRDDAWYIQKNGERHGPFTYMELVRGLQEKTVYEYDFVWKEGMETFMRIAEHPSFLPERIRELLAQKQTDQQVFVKRQHPRVKFESEIIVHDDRDVWMGQAFEASVGGSGLLIENSRLTPGQMVRIHFAPFDGLPAFNALGEIVGKTYSKNVRGAKSPVKYSVRFVRLDGSVEPQVREYFASITGSGNSNEI